MTPRRVGRARVVGWLGGLGLLMGCATAAPILTEPARLCDGRMVDHNRRACAERAGTWVPPVGAGCGRCER